MVALAVQAALMVAPAVALVALVVVQINRVILVAQVVAPAVVPAVVAPAAAVQINRAHRDLRLQKLHSRRMRTIAEHYRLKKIKPTAIQVAQRQELRFLMTLNRAIR